MERKSHLLKGIPVLASLNIKKTVEFYKTKLGFNKIGYLDDNYAVIARDNFVVHFWKCNDKIHPNGTLKNHPYGMREFAIIDLDGNLIKFGQEISE